MSRQTFLLLAVVISAWAAASSPAWAQTLYYDTNGTTVGFGNFAGTWNGTTSIFNTDATGGAGGSFFTTTNSSNSLIFAGGGNTGVITVLGNQTVGSIDFANTANLAALQVGGQNFDARSLTVTGNITDSGVGSSDIRVINLNSSAAATVLVANSITTSQMNFSTESFSNPQFFTTAYDITLSTQFQLGRGNGNYTYTQNGGTVTVADTSRGINFNADRASTSNTTSTRVHSYIMNGGQLQVGAIGVNTPNDGSNSGSGDNWSSQGRLDFNSGTIKTATANGTLTIGNGLSFNAYNGTGTRDMQYNTSLPFTVALSQTGTHALEANGANSTILVTPGAQFINKTGENGTLTKTGLGAVVFTGGGPVAVNSYTGNTTVTAGLVSTDYNRIAGQAATGGTDNLSNGYSAGSQLVLDGGSYSLVGRGSAAASSATGVTLNAGSAASALNVNVGSTAGLVIGQSVTNANLPAGTYIRRIISGSTIELNAMSTNGTTNQTGQTLNFGAASYSNTQTINDVSVLQNATVTVTPGAGSSTTLLSFGNFTSTAGLTKAGSGTLRVTGNVSHSGATAINAGTLDIASGSNATLTGAISGGGIFIKSGAGTLTINAPAPGGNSFFGDVIVNGGTLSNGAAAKGFFDANSFTVNSGGILETGADGLGFNNSMGSLVVNSGGIFRGGVQQLMAVTLNGGLIDGTAGNADTNFILREDVTVGGTSASTIQGNFGIALNHNTAGAGGTRTFNVADATGNADADLTISNGVRNAYLTNDSTNLQKTGLGTMVLSGSSIYSGTTTVSAGTLLVNGRLANTSEVSVSAGAVLGGTGSIASGVTVSGVLSPGASPGVLTMNSLVLQPGSTTLMEINGATRGSLYDGIDLTAAGGLTFGGTLSLSFGSLFADDTTFNLFSFTGAPIGGLAGIVTTGSYGSLTFTGSSGVWKSNEVNGQSMTFTESTGNLVIVPEPAGLALAGIGVILAGWSVARRQLDKRKAAFAVLEDIDRGQDSISTL